MRTTTKPRDSYLLHLRPEPGVDGVRALRAVLKRLLRSHGLQCTHIDTIEAEARPETLNANQHAILNVADDEMPPPAWLRERQK